MNSAGHERGAATRRAFLALLILTLAFRLWMAATLPISGDEAYFVYWGQRPDWGFYDHPPMIGWWLAALLQLSDARGWLRLPIVIQPAVLALATAAFLRSRGEAVAWLAATLVLLAPASVWGVLITTDTPLIYFSFFSAVTFIRAARDDDGRFYLLSGVLLGGAFLSKYFAVLLALAYLAHALYRPSRAKLFGLGWVMVGALPAALINAWWNMGHCWANIMFNVYNRNEDATLSGKTPLMFAVMMAYLLSPLVLWTLGRGGLKGFWRHAQDRALLLVAFVPLAVFSALSSIKVIGLHWVLSFVPFVLMVAATLADAAMAARLRAFFIGFAVFHAVVVFVIASLPVETWKRLRQYDGIVMTVKSDEVLAQLRPYEGDYAFAADGYSAAVTLSYNARHYFFVFGEGSGHARHDDILTDLRALDGRNILIFRKSAPDMAQQYAPYFREVEVQPFEVRGAHFWRVLGRGFKFAAYRDSVLAQVRARYYAIPRELPQTGCYFCERYFPDESCRMPLAAAGTGAPR